jgi:FkbM family methyltransferase
MKGLAGQYGLWLSTRTKVACARLASQGIAFARKIVGLDSRARVARGGIRWELDLREGIDLTIFLLGMFERETVLTCRRLIRPGDVVLDIGANIGAHTLYLARCVGPGGCVVAFEPTDFAFHKLVTNVGLNPELASRIRMEQVMLMEQPGQQVEPRLYSSWPLSPQADLHGKHCGRFMDTKGARAMTLDEYLDQARIEKVSFIKMDVDGHECGVLRGSKATLTRHQPVIVMELAPYVLAETGHSVDELLAILESLGYGLAVMSNGRPLPADPRTLRALIPDGYSLQVLAKPASSS